MTPKNIMPDATKSVEEAIGGIDGLAPEEQRQLLSKRLSELVNGHTLCLMSNPSATEEGDRSEFLELCSKLLRVPSMDWLRVAREMPSTAEIIALSGHDAAMAGASRIVPRNTNSGGAEAHSLLGLQLWLAHCLAWEGRGEALANLMEKLNEKELEGAFQHIGSSRMSRHVSSGIEQASQLIRMLEGQLKRKEASQSAKILARELVTSANDLLQEEENQKQDEQSKKEENWPAQQGQARILRERSAKRAAGETLENMEGAAAERARSLVKEARRAWEMVGLAWGGSPKEGGERLRTREKSWVNMVGAKPWLSDPCALPSRFEAWLQAGELDSPKPKEDEDNNLTPHGQACFIGRDLERGTWMRERLEHGRAGPADLSMGAMACKEWAMAEPDEAWQRINDVLPHPKASLEECFRWLGKRAALCSRHSQRETSLRPSKSGPERNGEPPWPNPSGMGRIENDHVAWWLLGQLHPQDARGPAELELCRKRNLEAEAAASELGREARERVRQASLELDALNRLAAGKEHWEAASLIMKQLENSEELLALEACRWASAHTLHSREGWERIKREKIWKREWEGAEGPPISMEWQPTFAAQLLLARRCDAEAAATRQLWRELISRHLGLDAKTSEKRGAECISLQDEMREINALAALSQAGGLAAAGHGLAELAAICDQL